jgi:pyruvate,water dikinase
MLRALVTAGVEIESALGEPADIEWAWSGGELHILQARPITNIVRLPPRAKEYSNVYVWTHVNFAETMPRPASPLGWSLMEYMADRAMLKGLRLKNNVGYRLFEFLFGRVYWNITPLFGSRLLYRLFSHSMESLAPSVKADVDRMFEEGSIRPKPLWTGEQKLILGLQLALALPLIVLSGVPWLLCYRRMARRLDELEVRLRRTLPLKAYLESSAEDIRRRYLPVFQLAVLFFGLYSKVAPTLLRMSLVEALELAGGEEPDKTTQADLSLLELAGKSPEEFPAALQRHLERFGHRGPKEQDIVHPRLADSPRLVDTLMKNLKNASFDRRDERKRRIQEKLRALPGWRRLLAEPFRRLAARYSRYREDGKHYLMLVFHQVRQKVLNLGLNDVFFYTIDEILKGQLPPIEKRKADWIRYEHVRAPLVVTSDGRVCMGRASVESRDVLRGDPASPGVVTGRVRVILDPAVDARLEPGDILVAPHTDPGWTPLFLTAAALITEVGGIISHGAVVARELGVPAVVNVRDATRLLKDGQRVTVDGTRGEVLLL